MNSITVTTEKELKKAISEHYSEILVVGKLAKKIKKAKKIKNASKRVMMMLAAACSAIVPLVALAPAEVAIAPPIAMIHAVASTPPVIAATAATGLSVPVLITISLVGLSLVSILFNDYTCIELGKDLKFVSKKEHNYQK